MLLTVLFFTVVDRSTPSDRFVADHAGQWGGATLYMSVFYLYLGAASAVCAYQWHWPPGARGCVICASGSG